MEAFNQLRTVARAKRDRIVEQARAECEKTLAQIEALERELSSKPEPTGRTKSLAIDAQSKLILAYNVGLRDESTCEQFLKQLAGATVGECQVTADGLGLYTYRVPLALGARVSFAQLVKNYSSAQNETRYSPAKIIGTEKIARFGQPDEDKVSTSYSERFNLSLRMHVRRFTRLTNAHSKTYDHHAAMTALFIAFYNFCRPNQALGKGTTPAMAAGLTGNRWDLETLLREAA